MPRIPSYDDLTPSIPDILPGGACESPFGPGAPAAHQADYSKRVPDAEVVRPANDRAEPVRTSSSDTSALGTTNIASLAPRRLATVPASTVPSGGGALPLVLGAVLTAAVMPAARRHLLGAVSARPERDRD